MNVAERTTDRLLELYQDHSQQVTELQHLVQQQYPPADPAHDIATAYLNDRITLFRFLKKANYVLPEAYNLVVANLAWRIDARCDHITPRDLEPNPLWTNNLVQLKGQDRYGHPLITIRLGKYISAPPQEYDLDEDEDLEATTTDNQEKDRFLEYKRYIIFVLECTRKLLWESSRRHPPVEHALQATLLLDLQGASVSDLDHQLITYTIDLLKHRYPSCLAQGRNPTFFRLYYPFPLFCPFSLLTCMECAGDCWRSRIKGKKRTVQMGQRDCNALIGHTDRHTTPRHLACQDKNSCRQSLMASLPA